MSVSRRKFLQAGTLVIVSAGVPLKALADEAINRPKSKSSSLLPKGQADALLHLNSETFSRHLNTRFLLRHGEAPAVAVKLVELNDWTPDSAKPSAAATGRECFALVFFGSLNTPLPQNTYDIEHDSLGKFRLLIVPVGKNKKGRYYEAVFNRLH